MLSYFVTIHTLYCIHDCFCVSSFDSVSVAVILVYVFLLGFSPVYTVLLHTHRTVCELGFLVHYKLVNNILIFGASLEA